MRANAAHYADVFSKGRSAYAIPEGALTNPRKLADLGAFFWWTSWVTSTNRPGDTVSYTQNWPHEPLVGNQPASDVLLWSLASVLLLIAGVGISVAFWNLVGAGLFGFLINPPIALYYMQGLNLTPLHGHTALFGVYGMLGIALMLFSFRMMQPEAKWRPRPLAWAFWSINVGLMAMSVMSLLPIGVLQTKAAIEQGTWWARSAEFLQTPLMDMLRWLRVPGDVLFAVGAVLLAWFLVGLKTGWSLERTEVVQPQAEPERLGAAAPAHAILRRR